jgi:hypothetical protein
MLNPEMGVLTTFPIAGGAVRFEKRRLGKGSLFCEGYCDHIETSTISTFGASDGGYEVMAAEFFNWGNVVKQRGEVGVCWPVGFGRKTEFVSVVNNPSFHLFLTSSKEQNAQIQSGDAIQKKIKTLGQGGFDTTPESLHPPLRPQIRQSGSMTYNSSAKRRKGVDLHDLGDKMVVNTRASSGQKTGRQSGAQNIELCQVSTKRGADSTRTKRELSGQGFVRQNPDRGGEGL